MDFRKLSLAVTIVPSSSKLNDRLGLADGGDLPHLIGVLKLLPGDVGGVLHNFERPPVQVKNGIVGALDPDLTPSLADPSCIHRPGIPRGPAGPRSPCTRGSDGRLRRRTCEWCRPLHFLRRVAHDVEENCRWL